MSKVTQELKELREKVAEHESLIHDIYGSLIRQLDKDIAKSIEIEPTARCAHRLYHFIEAEVAERKQKQRKPEYRYLKFGCLYNADEITKEEAMAMLEEGGGVYPELISIKEIDTKEESFKKAVDQWMGRNKNEDGKIDIIPHWFYGMEPPDIIRLHNECVDKINELVRAYNAPIEKPLCTEICADPELVEVPDSTKETEEVRQRERLRVATCPLKTKYRCQWDEPMKCPKCGSGMECYQVQTQPKAGSILNTQVEAFRCTNRDCRYETIRKRAVLPNDDYHA